MSSRLTGYLLTFIAETLYYYRNGVATVLNLIKLFNDF